MLPDAESLALLGGELEIDLSFAEWVTGSYRNEVRRVRKGIKFKTGEICSDNLPSSGGERSSVASGESNRDIDDMFFP